MLRDERLLGTVSTSTDEIYSSRMFRHLDFLLHELSLGLDEFDLYAVVAGPGSFTGLRVGLAAVKCWAEVYGKPVAAVSGLEVIAAQAHSAAPLLASVMDAHRGQVYFGFYRRTGPPGAVGLTREGDECVGAPEEFLESLKTRARQADVAIVTATPEVIADTVSRFEMASGEHIAVEQVPALLAPVAGLLGYRQALRGQVTDALHLDASYIRRSDAELHWKGP